MHGTALLLAGLAAVVAAVPALPVLDARHGRDFSCDVSHLTPPVATTPLPAPPANATTLLVAIGKGTQNYTCADSNPTTVPTALGALATLYNASCIAAASQSFLNTATEVAYRAPPQYLSSLPAVGHHYFVTSTTPTFNINNNGITECKKVANSTAPANSLGDVPWLYLQSVPTGTTSKIVAVYRVETQGGSAPANCSGITPGIFTVPYSAQYWFYST